MDLNDGMGKQKGAQGSTGEYETNVIMPHARRLERLTGGAGTRIRQLAEAYSLAAHSANEDARNTWFSPTSRGTSSLIDYILAHEDAHILSAGPIYNLGRQLQYIHIAQMADHVPVHLRIQLPQHHRTVSKKDQERVVWDKDLLMKDLVHGNRREEFITQMEADMKAFLQQPSTQLALESNTPDDYFDHLNRTLIATSETFFGKKHINSATTTKPSNNTKSNCYIKATS
jgi:hypothetical protein